HLRIRVRGFLMSRLVLLRLLLVLLLIQVHWRLGLLVPELRCATVLPRHGILVHRRMIPEIVLSRLWQDWHYFGLIPHWLCRLQSRPVLRLTLHQTSTACLTLLSCIVSFLPTTRVLPHHMGPESMRG